MSDEMSSASGNRSVPGWVIAAVAVLGVVALVGLVMAHNASTQTTEAQQTFDTKVKAIQQDFSSQIAQLQQHQAAVDTSNAGLQSDLTVVTKRLRLTQSDLKKARDEAEAIRTEDQQKIAEVDAAAKTELATKASTDEVKSVDGKVDVVRTDLSGTQNDLKMARSELGTLIARNHEDVEQLRRLG
jgi:biopolymer transport protein ExbB/TolQ